MKLLLLCVVIKEDTFHAGVHPKGDLALLTLLTDRLPIITQSTHKLFHFLALKVMPLLGILHKIIKD